MKRGREERETTWREKGKKEKVSKRVKRISQRGEQRRMEGEREHGLGEEVESKKKKRTRKKRRVSRYSLQHCWLPGEAP